CERGEERVMQTACLLRGSMVAVWELAQGAMLHCVRVLPGPRICRYTDRSPVKTQRKNSHQIRASDGLELRLSWPWALLLLGRGARVQALPELAVDALGARAQVLQVLGDVADVDVVGREGVVRQNPLVEVVDPDVARRRQVLAPEVVDGLHRPPGLP